MASAENDNGEQIGEHNDGEESNEIAIIRAQTFESLQILRNLLLLLLPKEDDGSPKLTDLLAALVAQQRDILVAIRKLQAGQNALLDRLGGKAEGDSQSGPTG